MTKNSLLYRNPIELEKFLERNTHPLELDKTLERSTATTQPENDDATAEAQYTEAFKRVRREEKERQLNAKKAKEEKQQKLTAFKEARKAVTTFHATAQEIGNYFTEAETLEEKTLMERKEALKKGLEYGNRALIGEFPRNKTDQRIAKEQTAPNASQSQADASKPKTLTAKEIHHDPHFAKPVGGFKKVIQVPAERPEKEHKPERDTQVRSELEESIIAENEHALKEREEARAERLRLKSSTSPEDQEELDKIYEKNRQESEKRAQDHSSKERGDKYKKDLLTEYQDLQKSTESLRRAFMSNPKKFEKKYSQSVTQLHEIEKTLLEIGAAPIGLLMKVRKAKTKKDDQPIQASAKPSVIDQEIVKRNSVVTKLFSGDSTQSEEDFQSTPSSTPSNVSQEMDQATLAKRLSPHTSTGTERT